MAKRRSERRSGETEGDLEDEETDEEEYEDDEEDESGDGGKDTDGDGKKKKRKKKRRRKRTNTITIVTGKIENRETRSRSGSQLKRWAGGQNISNKGSSHHLRKRSNTLQRSHAEIKAIDVAREDPSNVTVLSV